MPALIERPKMTKGMYQALKRHIMHEREKKKQEQEQDAQIERMKKERELRKRKEEEDSLTLEQTKEQIQQLETTLESLKQDKHELFSQLKKILHQEDDARRRAQIKEQSELLSQQQSYSHPISVNPHPMLLQPSVTGRLTMYKPQQSLMPVATGIKRARSPSPPPPAQLYQNPYDSKYPGQSFPAAKAQQAAAIHHAGPSRHTEFKPGAYPQAQPSTHVTYVSQAGATFPQQQQAALYTGSQSPAGKFQPPGSQSAFSSYPSHYAQHQKQITDSYAAAQGYALQRVQQPGYLASGHGSNIAIQHQLEHSGQKPAYPVETDKYKIQQQHVRGLAPSALPGQPAAVITQQIQLQQQQQQQQQPKPGVMAAYPQPRGQGPPAPAVSAYQPSSSQPNYASQAQQQQQQQQQAPAPGRPPHFASQQQGRYY